MLYSLRDLLGMTVRATDGDAGDVHDVYLDAREWRVRYLVVSTGPWLLGRRVLISPEAAGEPEWDDKVLPVDLTRDQVRESPDIDLDRPVSRQQLDELNSYYGWPAYWMGGPVAGQTPAQGYPAAVGPIAARRPEERVPEPFERTAAEGDPDLHSAREIIGYGLQAADGGVGSVDDLILDQSWTIRYLVVDTGTLLPGRKALIAPPWIRDVVWDDRKVTVDVTAETIRKSPEYDPESPIDRAYERRLHEHYGQTAYWADDLEGERRR